MIFFLLLFYFFNLKPNPNTDIGKLRLLYKKAHHVGCNQAGFLPGLGIENLSGLA